MVERWAGSMALTLALTDPGLDQQVQKAVSVYRAVGIEDLPQLLMARRVLQGRVGTVEELWLLVAAAVLHPGASRR